MIENQDVSPVEKNQPSSGPFLAKVVSHLDPTYMGTLEVQLLRPVGNSDSEGQVIQVKYMSPFYGVTSADHLGKENDYNNTQKSYGFWAIPPDPGTTVVVIFIDGDPKRGYWIGCVQDENMNFMVPGIAATQQVQGATGRLPTAEYNKLANETVKDPEQVKKPKHPLATVLETQGLIKDDTRGITTSSARRETPSMVFGISTPGPLDKSSGAKKGKIGKAEHKINNAFVSRLGGSTFVMDDGDDKFIRKSHASEGPPVYVAVEQGETGGKREIPHNELIRIRTRTGHQILLHNSEDLIYIANARGTAWIELTSNGKIDVYAADSISMHTAGDFNITADKDINLTSTGGSINLNSNTDFNATATGDWNIKAGAGGKLYTGGSTDIKSGGAIKNEAGGVFSAKGSSIDLDGGAVNLNCGAAQGAASAASAPVAPRVPMHEPWSGHENLHGQAVGYTTKTDTFAKVKGAEKK